MPEEASFPRVLVVDDDEDLRVAIAEFLDMHGFEALQARDGLEALLHVKRARPHAVVLDLMMPRLGGLQALKRIKAFDPRIVAVVMTGTADAKLQEQAMELGARAVLGKPVALADIVEVLQREPPRAPEASPPAGRVLVVDDEPEIVAMLVEFVAGRNYSVRTASDGGSAIRAVVEWAPDVVLLDVLMPGLSGVESLAAIRSVAPDVKVIMVSGAANTDLADRALAYGAFDYIAKPVDLDYLGRSVDTALLMRELERA